MRAHGQDHSTEGVEFKLESEGQREMRLFLMEAAAFPQAFR